MEDVTAGMVPVKSLVLGETWDGVLGVAPSCGLFLGWMWPPWFVVLKISRSSRGRWAGKLQDRGVPEVLLPLFLAEQRWLCSPVRLVTGSAVTGATSHPCVPPLVAPPQVAFWGLSQGGMGVQVQLVLRVFFQVPGAF